MVENIEKLDLNLISHKPHRRLGYSPVWRRHPQDPVQVHCKLQAWQLDHFFLKRAEIQYITH